jgi:hypothetical protein
MSQQLQDICSVTRRHFFKATGLGLGAMALESLLARDGVLAQSANPLDAKPPMFEPKAKCVIYLHMAGSPSQLELFEHKPELQKLHMKDCPPSFLEGKRFAFIKGVPKILAGQCRFERHGQSGQWTSRKNRRAFLICMGQSLASSHKPKAPKTRVSSTKATIRLSPTTACSRAA